MKSNKTIVYEFVEFIPDDLKDDTLYISIPFATATHLCCCGCGLKVVTPISPRDWKLIFDGETISLHPSIGNWNFPCKSHYFIRENKVVWADNWKDNKAVTTTQKNKFTQKNNGKMGKRKLLDFFFRKKR